MLYGTVREKCPNDAVQYAGRSIFSLTSLLASTSSHLNSVLLAQCLRFRGAIGDRALLL
jgi:hypothetical protein